MSKVKNEAQSVCQNLDWSKLFYNPKEVERLNVKYRLQDSFEEGIEQGSKQGSNKRNIEIILNMLKLKVPKKLILKYLGISENEYNEIISQKSN